MAPKNGLSVPDVMAQRINDAAGKLNYPSGQKIFEYLRANKEYVPYKVINESDKPVIEVEVGPGERKQFSPEEVSAMIL